MGYDCIRIERERSGFCVHVTDPEIVKSNRESDRGSGSRVSEWKDPHVEFKFDTKAQALKFVESAMDIALPEDEYSTAFDKLAKEAQGKS